MKDKTDPRDADETFTGLDPEMMLQLVEALVELHPDKSILFHEAGGVAPLEFNGGNKDD